MSAEVPTDDPDDDDDDLEIDDPDLCDFCHRNNARWLDQNTGYDWCGECDRTKPNLPKPSEN